MDKVLEITENNITEIDKKVWSKPVFEVISKDVIKGGGAASTAEGTSYHS